jgi:hypothetical protein
MAMPTAMVTPVDQNLHGRVRPAAAAVRPNVPGDTGAIDTRTMRQIPMGKPEKDPQPDRAAVFPADDVLWGIAIRDGFDELDDPWYHRGVMQHAFLHGNDRTALCGFRPPLSGSRDRRRARLGLPVAEANPFCEGCVRRIGPPRRTVAVPVVPQPARVPVPMGIPVAPRSAGPVPGAVPVLPMAAQAPARQNGHPAGIVPGQAAVPSPSAVRAPSPAQGPRRVTVTGPVGPSPVGPAGPVAPQAGPARVDPAPAFGSHPAPALEP